jgi:hypothetical protein
VGSFESVRTAPSLDEHMAQRKHELVLTARDNGGSFLRRLFPPRAFAQAATFASLI